MVKEAVKGLSFGRGMLEIWLEMLIKAIKEYAFEVVRARRKTRQETGQEKLYINASVCIDAVHMTPCSIADLSI